MTKAEQFIELYKELTNEDWDQIRKIIGSEKDPEQDPEKKKAISIDHYKEYYISTLEPKEKRIFDRITKTYSHNSMRVKPTDFEILTQANCFNPLELAFDCFGYGYYYGQKAEQSAEKRRKKNGK